MPTAAEDNPYPHVKVVETAAASVPTPAAGKQHLFIDTDHAVKLKDSSATVTAVGGGGSGTVTHTGGALTSGKVVVGAGTDDIDVSTLTATVVKMASGTPSAASAGTDYVAPGGALGTPSSGTLTSCTGLPTAGLVNNAVTNAKLAQMAQHTFKGNNTGSTADPVDMTVTQATAELNAMVGDSGSGGTKGLVPAPAAGDTAAGKFLKADGTWSAPSGTGAPSSAQYVTLATDSGLSAERVLTAGTGISISDGGANGNVTISATAAGAWTQLSQVVTSGSQASVDFTGISGSYNSLKLIWICRDTNAGTSSQVLRMRINNDSTSGNYTTANRSGGQNGSAFGNTNSATSNGAQIGFIIEGGNSAGIAGTGETTIVAYANTTWHKRVFSVFGSDDASTNVTVASSSFRWKSTSAITQITMYTDGTAFANGSVFTLYGVN